MTRTPEDTQPPSRRNRACAIGAGAGPLAATVFARAGFSDPNLVLHWNEIAGPQIARLAQPIKFSQGPRGGTLSLRTVPGAALFLAHETRGLCERINAYLGAQVVTQLKFSQGLSGPRPSAPLPAKAPNRLPATDPSLRYQGPEGLAKALQALARRR
jgi:hypothetical protein